VQDDPLHSACGKKEETPLHLLGKCCAPVLVLLWFALIQRDMVMEVDGIRWGTSVEKVLGSHRRGFGLSKMMTGLEQFEES